MTDTDFDFDFDVGRDRSSRGDGENGGSNGSGAAPPARANGSNGGSGERDPFDALGEDVPRRDSAGDPAGADDPGLRRFRPRRNGSRRAKANGGNGNGNGARPAKGDGRATPESRPPLVYEDGGNGAPPSHGSSRSKPADEPPAPAPSGDDWLSLADDEPGADLGQIARPDDGPAGPRTPAEGRNLAREARRRATGASTTFDALPSRPRRERRDEDFEAALESQPQKGELARRGSAVVYGLRGLLDDGRRRLSGARHGLSGARGRISELRERVPSRVPGAAPAGGGSGDGGEPPVPRLPMRLPSRRPRKPKPGRVKKLRLAIIVVGLGALAMVSTVFGMMTSVSRDLPALENKEQYAKAKNSEVFDAQGRKLGTLLSNDARILIDSDQISPYIKQAVVSIEDQRFYEHDGVDFQGIARALGADLMPGGSTQGASTITMQFVKNALEAQGSRTAFQKLREAALAYHIERQWTKDKILTQYLNTIYFGEGAYGVEAAARTYFGDKHPGCGTDGADSCASEVTPAEAALLAGIITSPSAFSPRANPNDSLGRRNLVLSKMHDQGLLSDQEYEDATREAPPAPSEIEKPAEDSLAPYFTSWLRQQVVDKYGPGRAFGGGLDVHTTLDLDMQQAAESAAYNTLAGVEPTASVVVIDNKTGGVKAMVGGNDFEEEPFNLATNGHRQPGSSFKPFTLITAFQNGFGPSSTFNSAGPLYFTVPNSGGKEKFEVNNYDSIYYGTSDLYSATLHSDNSVFAQLGFGPSGLGRKGPQKVGRTASRMGIDPADFDTNPAMILGGIDPGVTPLEMAYAYSTIARGGVRVGGELDSSQGPNNDLQDLGPTAMEEVVLPDGKTLDGGKNYKPKEMRAIPEAVANSVKSILHANVLGGTAERAQMGDPVEWGKTGTTDNNGDAWFCGGTTNFTACVWVGHAQSNEPMETEFGGLPVDGGTFPAVIWAQVMSAVESIYASEKASEDSDSSSGSSGYVAPSTGYSGGSSGSSGSTGGGGGGGAPQPAAPAPAAPAPSPSGGGTGGTGGTGL